MNVQDVFLNRLRRSEEPCVAVLIDGTECRGLLVVFDAATLIMNVNGSETLLYKQNVVSIASENPYIRVFTEAV